MNYKNIQEYTVIEKGVEQFKQKAKEDLVKQYNSIYNNRNDNIIVISMEEQLNHYIYSLFGFNKEYYEQFVEITNCIITILKKIFAVEYNKYNEKQQIFIDGFNDNFENFVILSDDDKYYFERGRHYKEYNIYSYFIDELLKLNNIDEVINTFDETKEFFLTIDENNFDDDNFIKNIINVIPPSFNIKYKDLSDIKDFFNDINKYNIYESITYLINSISLFDIIVNEFQNDYFDEELYAKYLATAYCYLLYNNNYALKQLSNIISNSNKLWSMESLNYNNLDDLLISDINSDIKMNIYSVIIINAINIIDMLKNDNDSNKIIEQMKNILQFIYNKFDLDDFTQYINENYIKLFNDYINFF